MRVSYEGETGFVSAEYVRVEFGIDTAESMAAIREREEAERARAAAEAQSRKVQQKEAVLASATELEILAALIQCEAGGEPYEGQVAVGAVVMNRVRCGGYPNNITDVIYASGQFVPASGGRMESDPEQDDQVVLHTGGAGGDQRSLQCRGCTAFPQEQRQGRTGDRQSCILVKDPHGSSRSGVSQATDNSDMIKAQFTKRTALFLAPF